MTKHGLSARALIIGCLLAAMATAAVAFGEWVRSTQMGIIQFAPAAVGLLLIVALANLVLRNLGPRLALRPGEIVIVYAMALVAALVASRGILEKWLPTLVLSNYFATPANHWADLLFQNYKPWAVPWDISGGAVQTIARTYYEGVSPGAPIPWQPWVQPILAWTVCIGLFVFAFLCQAAILRRQWVDNEKLAFPLTILPLEIATDRAGPKSFFRNKAMWLGLLIPVAIHTVNGLHANFPALPKITMNYDLGQALSAAGRPWDAAANWTYIQLSLGALGFFYFLPAELLLTMWFFFWFARVENILFSAFGASFEGMPMYPTALWNGYQSAGAFLVLAGYMTKSAWPYLRQVWQSVEDPARRQERELLPLRLAVVGLALASLGAAVFFWKLGMTPGIALLEVLGFLFVTIPVMARSVNEVGLLETETSWRPIDLYTMFAPIQSLGAQTMTALSLTDAVFMRDQRGNLLSAFLDSLRLADRVQLDRRALLWALVAGLVISLVFGSFLGIALPYRLGAVQMDTYVFQGTPRWTASDAATNLQATPKGDHRLPLFFGSGVLITLALTFLRTRYLWWPLAPIGMALSGTWGIITFWFTMFIAWLIKTTIMRYGGMRVFLALRPFFLGLILGEFLSAVVWAALAAIWRLYPPPFVLG
jgi:hypothetical protein